MNYGYISKRVRIEAFRWSRGLLSWPRWIRERPWWLSNASRMRESNLGAMWIPKDGIPRLRTKNGVHKINDGDYIVYLAPDDIYPCPAAVFEAKYEPEVTK